MTKSYLINTSVAALVSTFVFAASVSSASACWGDKGQYGGSDCGKDTSSTSAPDTQTQSIPARKPQTQWDNGGGYGGDNVTGKDSQKSSQQSQTGGWNDNQKPSKQAQTGGWNDNGNSGNTRPQRPSTGTYGDNSSNGDRPSRRPSNDDYGDNSSSRGPLYHPNRESSDNGDYYPDRHPRRPMDSYGDNGGYGDRPHHDDDYRPHHGDDDYRPERPSVHFTWGRGY